MSAPPARRTAPGWPLVVGLGALAVPRAVLHDLDVATEGSPVTVLLALGPVAVWVAAIVARHWAPVATGLRLGAVYAVGLAVVHQALWSHTLGDDGTRPGGELADVPAGASEAVLRTAVTLSSLATGVAVGVVAGLLARLAQRLLHRPPGEVVPAHDVAISPDPGHFRPGLPRRGRSDSREELPERG